MKHLFIPHHLAVLAKQKGFDESCLAGYTLDGEFAPPDNELNTFRNRNRSGGEISAPLYQQIIDWFRAKGVEIDIMRYTYSGGVYQGKKYMWMIDQYDEKYDHELEENPAHWIINERKSQGYDFTHTYDALNVAIEEAFKLI